MQLSFLLYDNRSGSTLLSALLNQYEPVCVSIETDLAYQIIEYKKDLTAPYQMEAFVNHLFSNTRFPELQIDRTKVEKAIYGVHIPSKANILYRLLELYLLQNDSSAEYLMVKGPRLYQHINKLLNYYPEAKFIQIIRDGRAVYSSKSSTSSIKYVHGKYINRGPMNYNVLHAALLWRKKLRIADRFREHVLDIRYEDLVRNEEKTLATVLDFLSVPQSNRFITKRKENYLHTMNHNYYSLHSNVCHDSRHDFIDKWKDRLTPEEICLYQLINRHYLSRYAYGNNNIRAYDFSMMYGVLKLCIKNSVDIIRKRIISSKLSRPVVRI